ncbi:peptidoglycan-binding domain-containing protein [Streptomyces showdoensis]|uniref:peptidoglycan-binding domain-containing protein n=1 Tax=Streptomyces showdoensis TaxID=68268 RepID=UPI00103ACE5D|nr:peptidoglycan-binding domain-containing protein [Streptomyces showdoensis]
MRNRTALTEAVTSSAPEPQSYPGGDSLVFGMVAGPGVDGSGAREQDVSLFDGSLSAPRGSGEGAPRRGRHVAEKSRRARKAPRPRRAESKPEREGAGLSLPLLIAGALAAGFGLTVGLTSGLEQQTPDNRTLTMPDLLQPGLPLDAEQPAATQVSVAPTARTTPPAPPTSRATPTATHAPTGTHAPARTSTPPPATPPPAQPPTRTPPPTERPAANALRLGSSGPEVKDLQRRLQQLHLYLGSADGMFGAYLEAALTRFQVSRGILGERGVYGPSTRAALQAESDREADSDRNRWDRWDDWDDDRGGRDR